MGGDDGRHQHGGVIAWDAADTVFVDDEWFVPVQAFMSGCFHIFLRTHENLLPVNGSSKRKSNIFHAFQRGWWEIFEVF